MSHYIVTGGAGFIGSNLIRELLRRDVSATITCIDNFDPFYPVAIKQLNIRDFINDSRFRLLTHDLGFMTASELSEAIPEPVDAIIHLAARAGVRPSINNPEAYQQTNVMGLQHLLDFANEKGVRQFVFASSSSVYGVNDHYPWKEEEQLMPISPYASTKLSGEMMGHVYHKLFGIRFLALRLFTVYGPGQRPDLAIHKFTKAMLKGEPITMYGEGTTSRDYTFVGDTVQGILGALTYNQSGFEVINLGNNYTVSLKELIAAIETVTGKKAIIEQYPDQPGDVPRTFADISKAKRLLGYAPHTQLKEGLEAFYAWFTTNQELLMH